MKAMICSNWYSYSVIMVNDDLCINCGQSYSKHKPRKGKQYIFDEEWTKGDMALEMGSECQEDIDNDEPLGE